MYKEKRELLARKREALDQIHQKAAAENRSLTPEETAEFDTLEAEIRSLTREVERLRVAEDNQAILAGRNGVHVGVEGNRNASDRDGLDLSGFSLGRVISRKLRGENLEGIDAEVVQEGFNEARGHGFSPEGNVVLPYELFALNREGRDLVRESVERRAIERRDLTSTGTTTTPGDQGGQTVQTTVGRLYEALFSRLVLRDMGATFMPNMRGNLTLPRMVKGTTPTWKAENAAADETSPTFVSPTLSPKRLPTFIEVSNQLLTQSEANIQQVIERYLGNHLSSLFDFAGINGSGPASQQPLGILNTPGIGLAYAGGAATNSINPNGAAPVWSDAVNLYSLVAAQNADYGNMGYLLNPLLVGKLQTTAKANNTAAVFILGEGAEKLNAFKTGITNNVPANLIKGTSSNLTSLIFGNFTDLYMAMWGGIELLVNPYSRDFESLTRINAAIFGDVAVARPESFAVIKDINPA